MPTFAYTVPARATTPVREAGEGPLLGATVKLAEETRQISAKGDYATLDGPDALEQRVKHRMTTDPAEYLVDLEYGAGWKGMVNKPDTPANRALMAERARDQLSHERGIASVTEVSVGAVEYIEGQPVTRGVIKYETAEGEAADAALMLQRRG